MTPQELVRLQTYLRKIFDTRALSARSKKDGSAEVLVGDSPIATITIDDEDGDRAYQFAMELPDHPREAAIKPQDLVRFQTYLRQVLGTKTLSVRARPRKDDSAEVYVGDEFIATITVDEGDRPQFQMAILDMDLEDV